VPSGRWWRPPRSTRRRRAPAGTPGRSRRVPASGPITGRPTTPVMAAVPVPVVAPAWIPVLTRAPGRERPRLRLSVGGDTHAGQTHGGSGQNRCSKTWNCFHEAVLTHRSCGRNCRRQRFFLSVSCQFGGTLSFDRSGTRRHFGPPAPPCGSVRPSPGTAPRRVGTRTSAAAQSRRTAGRGRARAAPR
jgi:hypothetical protein